MIANPATMDWYEPLIMPGCFTVFGLLIWWLAMMAEQKGKTAHWKWIGAAFLVIAMWFGFPYFGHMIGSSTDDVLYRNALPAVKRYQYTHYGAFLVPLFALIACFIWQFFNKKPATPEAPAPAAE